ncbi:hypothetical protein IPM09_00690 [Candidatus Saccharibacteria bacterium]|nr:MAG: hypothetical protein IPM09_00690 [Candidatus Saccharibacteria bacterium]
MKPKKIAKRAAKKAAHKIKRGMETAADVVLLPVVPFKLTRSLAAAALDMAAFGSETVIRVLPNGLRETIVEAFPTVDANELYVRVLDRIQSYARRGDTESSTDPYERIKTSVQTFELETGKTVTMRAPQESDRLALESLYLTMSDDDRYTRFFGGMSPQSARDSGMKCSSLTDPNCASDIVIVDGDGTVGGHAGYVIYDDGLASLHIVVRPEYRKATQTGGRMPQIMFEQVIATAMLDERTCKIVAETLFQNNGINKLVGATMGTHEGFQRSSEYGYLENELPVR